MTTTATNITMGCFTMALAVILIAGTVRKQATYKRQLLLAAMFLHLVAVGADLLSWLGHGHVSWMARAAVQVGSELASLTSPCIACYVMAYIVTDAVDQRDGSKPRDLIAYVVYILGSIGFLLALSNPWSHLLYTVTEDNTLAWGALGSFPGLLLAFQSAALVPPIVGKRHINPFPTTLYLLASAFMHIVGCVLNIAFPDIVFMLPCSSLALLLITMGVQARLEEDLTLARAEAAESRVRLLTGQISPHFVFNSLTAIKELVSEDPDRAEAAIQDFSDYLRSHLDVMSTERLVAFDQEMSHVLHYVELEMADQTTPMEVSYDIAEKDFMLPPLTVQPLVENAIRHGLRTRAEGGSVVVTTRREGENVVVSVIDDGAGFSTATPRQTERALVGIANVSERIERMCGGTLVVGDNGAGTTATLTIPVWREERADEGAHS